MPSYTRLGSYLLATDLAVDAAGKVHRGLTLNGSTFRQHLLVRTFTEELLDAGMRKVADAQKVVDLLMGSRGFGVNYVIEAGKGVSIACDYIPGRSLAQVLKKTREEQIPLGVDHALSVLQGVAQSILQLHGKGVHHGILTPDSIWLSYEGATHILDAPYAATMAALLPKAHALQAASAPYRSSAASTPLQKDLFALGAILYELLTLEKLPAAEGIPEALSKATLKAAQEEGTIPSEITGLLNRLLLVSQPFADAGSFNAELEKVLYDGEYSPTTFNMAFFMHTLLREESDADTQAIKADQGADFTPFLGGDEGSRSMLDGRENSNLLKYGVIGGAVLAVAFGALLLSTRAAHQRNDDLEAKIASLQRENAANDAKLTDLSKAQDDQKHLQDQLTKKAAEAKTVEEKTKAKQELEEAKKKTEELARQREDALKKRQELNARTQSIAQAVPPPPAQQAAPKPEPPKQEAPKSAAPEPIPTPAPVQQAKAAPASGSADATEVPPAILKRAVPAPPRMGARSFLPPYLRDTEIKVSLKVFVDGQGRPLKVVITKGVDGPFGYNDSAQTAALASSYTPAQRGGKPTTGWLNMEYNFGRPR